MHWYVIRTKPNQERKAEFHLRQFSVETFLPMLKHNKKLSNVHKTVVEPLFPQYLFARFDIKDQYRAVNFTRGVVKIVEFGLRPAEVSEAFIDAFKQRLQDGCFIPDTETFHAGQLVQIKNGPLAGIEALFVRQLTQRHRVCLLLQTLGLYAKLTVDIDQICLPQTS